MSWTRGKRSVKGDEHAAVVEHCKTATKPLGRWNAKPGNSQPREVGVRHRARIAADGQLVRAIDQLLSKQSEQELPSRGSFLRVIFKPSFLKVLDVKSSLSGDKRITHRSPE